MNLRIRLVIFSTVLILLAGCGTGQPSGTLQVGALLPQTGAGAVFADYIQKGLDLAAEEINAKEPNSIALVYGDSKNDPKEGVSVFQQLTLTKKPPVVITALSSVTKAVAPLAKPNNTVVIGTAVGLPGVTAPSEFVFRVYPEAHGLAGVIAKYAAQKYKTAAVAFINDDFGASGADVFRKGFEAGGGKVLKSEPYNPTEKDFRTQWEKIKEAKPECVWITGYGPAYSVLIKQFRETQVGSVLLADMTLGLPVTLKTVGDAAEGVVYVDGPMKADFIERYQKKYGDRPTSYAGYAYDILMILNRVRKDNGTSPEQIRNGFAAIRDFPGAMGDVTILPSRDASLKFTLMQIKNGRQAAFKD
jgi:branched-chain amino acid transport system substrate-binding protein